MSEEKGSGKDELRHKMKNIGEVEQNYNSILFGWHFKGILKRAVKIADLQGNETILDYGCGTEKLKEYLPKNCNYIPYDKFLGKTPDFENRKIDVVFLLNVVEHLTREEIRELMSKILNCGTKKIVIAIPNGRFINKFFEIAQGIDHLTFFVHNPEINKLGWMLKEILGYPTKAECLHWTQYIAVWEMPGIFKKGAGK